MSKLKEQLRAMGIYNNYELTRVYGEKGTDVWVEFESPRHVFYQRGTRVYSHSHRPDRGPHGHFGAQMFPGKRDATLPKAMAWATERYKVDDWAPSPFGGRVPRYIRAAAEAAVKEH